MHQNHRVIEAKMLPSDSSTSLLSRVSGRMRRKIESTRVEIAIGVSQN